MAKVKSWREGAAGEPKFAPDFEIVKKEIQMQVPTRCIASATK